MVAVSLKKKNLKIEAEKGFRRTLFEPELVDPNLEINFDDRSEGNFSLEILRMQLWINAIEREIF